MAQESSAAGKGPVVVVSDSASSLSPAKGRELGVHIVPVYLHFGTQTYRDGVDLDADRFYSLLRASSKPPSTAQPAVADFVKAYTEIWEGGLAERGGSIVSIHPSGKMSATVDSSRAARNELPHIPVHVIDSRNISLGLGLIVMAAARAAAAGADAEAVVQLVEELILRVNVVFTPETLEFLHRGGRIGGAAALVGSLLSIKPVLYLKDGRVETLEKQRTRKRAVGYMLDWVVEQVGPSATVHAGVLHCDAPQEGQSVADMVAERLQCTELLVMEAGPTIGTHAGPGTVGVVFYRD